MSLLHACFSISRVKGLHLEVAHVDHALRAKSVEDAKFVRQLCAKFGVTFHLKNNVAPPKRGNKEAWARELRYGFFSLILGKRKLDYAVTAHTADDVAETFLMRLLANKELYSIEQHCDERKLLRPLLCVPRRAIHQYISEHRLKFVEDETNANTELLRNRVRHLLIPFIKKHFEPRIEEVIAQRALFLADDLKLLNSQCTENEQKLSRHEFGSQSWLRNFKELIRDEDTGGGWRLVEKVFLDKLGFRLGRHRCERLAQFILGTASQHKVVGGLTLRRKDGGIVVKSGV